MVERTSSLRARPWGGGKKCRQRVKGNSGQQHMQEKTYPQFLEKDSGHMGERRRRLTKEKGQSWLRKENFSLGQTTTVGGRKAVRSGITGWPEGRKKNWGGEKVGV